MSTHPYEVQAQKYEEMSLCARALGYINNLKLKDPESEETLKYINDILFEKLFKIKEEAKILKKVWAPEYD